MKRNIYNSLCVLLLLCGGVTADYVWDGGTGAITGATWNSGQASPFATNESGIDQTTANQSIYINSGSVTSNGFALKTNGSSLGSEEPYANRTVLRLTGGSLNTGSKDVSIGAGSGFIQTGGTLTLNASSLALDGSKVKNVFGAGTNSDRDSITIGTLTSWPDSHVTFGGYSDVSIKTLAYYKFSGSTAAYDLTFTENASVNLSNVTFGTGSKLEISGEAQVTWTIQSIPANTNLLVSGNAKLTLSPASDPELTAGVVGFEIAGGTVEVGRTFNLSALLTVSGGSLTMTNANSGNINVSNTSQTGKLTISSGSITANNIRVANVTGAKGEMTISGGTVNQTAASTDVNRRGTIGFYVGNQGNTVGTLTITGGELNTADDFYVGNYGTGTVTQSSGTVTAAKALYIGPGGTGTWNLSGDGSVNVTGQTFVGSGTGTGTLSLSGNGSLNVADRINIGSGTGTGKFVMTGGTLTSTMSMGFDVFYLGNSNTVEAVAEISGGTVSLLGQTRIGLNSGNGKLLLSGGTFKTQNSIYLGSSNASTTGTVLMTGGNWESGNNTVVGENGIGTFTQTGGTIKTGTVSNQYMDFLVARKTGSTGTYTISGGSLDTTTKHAGRIFLGMDKDGNVGGTGTMIVNGGTVKAAAFNMTDKCSLIFNVDGGNFGTMAITGAMTLAGSNNAINISSRSMFQTDVPSANLLTVGSGDLTSLNINNEGSAWEVNKTNGSGVQISLKNLQTAAYTVDSGALSINNLAAGALQIIPNNDRYDLYLTVNNLTDEYGGGFATWLAENSDYSVTYIGNSVVQVGIFENLPKYFAWDFTGFTPVPNLTLSSLTGSMHVPEPAAWVLLVLGILGSAVIRRVSAFTAFTSGKTAR